MRKEELALKRSDQENVQLHQTMVFDQQKTMFQYFQAQQAQQQKQMQEITMAMLQQQQLQNQAFMLFAKLNEK